MMNADKLPWYLRILYLLPIFICIAITVNLDIEYTAYEHPSSAISVEVPDSEDLEEETQRGEEILEQQRKKEELSENENGEKRE